MKPEDEGDAAQSTADALHAWYNSSDSIAERGKLLHARQKQIFDAMVDSDDAENLCDASFQNAQSDSEMQRATPIPSADGLSMPDPVPVANELGTPSVVDDCEDAEGGGPCTLVAVLDGTPTGPQDDTALTPSQ